MGRKKLLSINVVIVLVALILPAHADEQNTALQTDTAPIENPPLPRPKPSLLDATGDDPAVLISAFRHQHGEDSVVLLLHGAKWIGVAHAQNGHRTYWAMVIGTK